MKFSIKLMALTFLTMTLVYAGALETAKTEIGRQLELLKKGEIEKPLADIQIHRRSVESGQALY